MHHTEELVINANGKYVEILNKTIDGRVGLITGVDKLGRERDLYITILSAQDYHLRGIYLSEKETCRILEAVEIKQLFDIPKLIKGIALTGCQNGTDPEVFVVDEDDVIIPAFTFLPSKTEGNPFWDGFQAEFTTTQTHCLSYLVDDIRGKLKNTISKAKEYNKHAKLTWKSVLDIPYHIMEQANPTHLELGCAPSLNIYGTEVNMPDPATLPFRFAGCHLHFGLLQKSKQSIEKMIKSLDSFFGIISIALLQGMEDPRRRLYYGLAGEYRLPKHGIEYRTPSSALLAHPALFHLCYDLARASLYLGLSSILFHSDMQLDDERVIDIINTYDVEEAKKYLKKRKIITIAVLGKIYPNADSSKLFNLIMNGFMNYIDISDMEKNWKLPSNITWISHSGSPNCSVFNLHLPKELLCEQKGEV